jgi:acylphosphatase
MTCAAVDSVSHVLVDIHKSLIALTVTLSSFRLLSMKKRVRVIFSGMVQGIGFRFTAEAIASSLDVDGWVRNLRTGQVELVAEQEEKVLEELMKRLEGRFPGAIKGKDVAWDAATGEFKGFTIRF